MFKQSPTKTYNWILIIGVILFLFEVTFFYGGAIIPALFSGFFLYVGWMNFYKLWGKILFWTSLISLIFSVLNLMAVRFFIFAAIVIFIINFSKRMKEPIKEELILPGEKTDNDLIRLEPLFDHSFFDDQYTKDSAYQWRDINIHAFFGDRVIDLSNTVLPNDTAVISIRHAMGNIEIYVPYEVEVSVHHSALFGKAHIFQEKHDKLFNKSLLFQTKDYDTATTRVKIITSVISGDIEVKRI